MAWALNFSFGHNRHGHEGGTIGTGCVCGGGGGTGPSEVGTLSISASVFTVWGTSESAEGMTLFSVGSGTGHHGGRHHSYIVGVWGHLVRGMGLVSSEPNPGDILDTGGGGGCFRIIRLKVGPRHHYSREGYLV